MRDFTKLLLGALAASIAGGASAAGYTTGVFLLNEGQYGKPASICHLDAEGNWTDRAFAAANGETTLGNTGAYAQFYGDDLYIVSKQANATGAILSKADASTLVLKASVSDLGIAGVQGRAFLAVNLDKAYLGTTKGVVVVNLADLSVSGVIEGILNEAGKEVECGNMFRVNDRVFITTKSPFIYVVDPATDAIAGTIDMVALTGNEKAKAASIVVANDGAVWASVAGGTNGSTLPYLVKITQSETDCTELVTEVIDIPEDIYAPANSWYTWTPDAFCASPVAPVLYWNGGASSFASNKELFRYDIESGEFSKFYGFAEDQFLYGSAMRVSPLDGDIYLAYVSGSAWSDETTLARLNSAGEVIAAYPMTKEYWFPALPLFPDNAAPVAASFEKPFAVDADQPSTVIDLRDIATDADSHNALMIKSLAGNPNPELAEMEVKHGLLTVYPTSGANGAAVANINVNSNGKETVVAVPLSISSTSGVENVAVSAEAVTAYRIGSGAVCLSGSGVAEVYSISGALVACVTVDGMATVDVPAGPVVVRFADRTFKL
ncbi:MAG: DUF5074 domain-containing protein [Muribaculaceae bacterium]|nr:DUF5074 domain-containing protein [Muribaculaceae bacterium]